MKAGHPLDSGRGLQELDFPTMRRKASWCIMPVALGARKAAQSSLKIQ